MKRILALTLALVLAFSLAAAASAAEVQYTSQHITINGEAVSCPAYNIDGYNYVRLRTLAALFMNTDSPFDVQYDKATNTVFIQRGKVYSGKPEEAGLMIDLSGTAVPSAQRVVIDDVERTDLSVWNLGESNWFKLAELADAIGFGLSFDGATDTAAITTWPSTWNASDYAQVYKAITKVTSGDEESGYRSGASNAVTKEASMDMAAEVPAAEMGAGGTGGDYSGTNVQVEGFDEGDIVKTDGKYLYVIHDDEIIILRADGAKTAEISRTEIGFNYYEENDDKDSYYYASEYKTPCELFVSDGRLAVISNYSKYSDARVDGKWQYTSKNYTCIEVYDVSDPAAPKLLQSLGQDGYTLGTRMIGGRVYLLTSYWVWDCEEDDPTTYVPGLYRGGEMHILPAEKIYIDPDCSSTEYVVLCAYDMATGACTASQSALGCGDILYMNDSGIYVMGSRWIDDVVKTYTESVYTVEEHLNTSETQIIRFAIDDLRVTATGKVPGYLDSQFSADEYQGNLRLVTTRNDSSYKIYKDEQYDFWNYRWDDREPSNGLYILGADLQVVGKIEDLAPGERVYSARFDGPIAYFTTFRNIDPLFAADVSDPTAPKILSALKISGFSEYLHSWGENRLFGIGREADEEDGWSQGLKLVMFDTSDKTNVNAKYTLVLDDFSYSEALYDHKAVFIDPARGYIGFPADDEYLIYAYDDANGFRLMYELGTENYWMGSARGFRIGEDAYIVGYSELFVISMRDWTWTMTLALEQAKG